MRIIPPQSAATSRDRKGAVTAAAAPVAVLALALLLLATPAAFTDDDGDDFLPQLPADPVRDSLHALDLDGDVLLERMTGSTSAQPLLMLIVATHTQQTPVWTAGLSQRLLMTEAARDAASEDPNRPRGLPWPSGTHRAYAQLIEGGIDLAIIAREPSEDELTLLAERGVELEVRPVAMDAFVFIVHPEHDVEDLSLDDIREIFTPADFDENDQGRPPPPAPEKDGLRLDAGRITDWSELGGAERTIRPITRDRNSGSEQLMRKLVMRDRPIVSTSALRVLSMTGPIDQVAAREGTIAYSVHYYRRFMTTGSLRARRSERLDSAAPARLPKVIAVDGVAPTPETIADGTYPLREPVYVVIRADTPADHWARRLRDWLLTDDGQQLVAASGYVPINAAAPLAEQAEQADQAEQAEREQTP